MNSTVEILLSTYNGEKYLREQLDSIIHQDYTHWKLLVRDDGSTDGTIAIINDYIQKYPEKIVLKSDNDGNLGHSLSYSKLLKLSSADFVMYCDQDDYWYPAKISTMLSLLLAEEALNPNTPLIVFSDLHVADSGLKIISNSFLKKVHYSNKKGQQVFFLRNYIPGCNLIFNRLLIQQAFKTENIVRQHDHWLLMLCSVAGKLICIDKPLMKYRIHDNNTIGYFPDLTSFSNEFSVFLKNIFKYTINNKKYRQALHANNTLQVEIICSSVSCPISKEAELFLKINESNYFARKLRNMTRPYILETNFLKQLTYIICF